MCVRGALAAGHGGDAPPVGLPYRGREEERGAHEPRVCICACVKGGLLRLPSRAARLRCPGSSWRQRPPRRGSLPGGTGEAGEVILKKITPGCARMGIAGAGGGGVVCVGTIALPCTAGVGEGGLGLPLPHEALREEKNTQEGGKGPQMMGTQARMSSGCSFSPSGSQGLETKKSRP